MRAMSPRAAAPRRRRPRGSRKAGRKRRVRREAMTRTEQRLARRQLDGAGIGQVLARQRRAGARRCNRRPPSTPGPCARPCRRARACAPCVRAAPAATAARLLTGRIGWPPPAARPWAMPAAIRRPVKPPGPRPNATASRSRVVEARLAQQLVRHRQQPAGMAASDHFEALGQRRADEQRRRTRLGCRIDRQDLHASAHPGRARPARASRRRRNAAASSSSVTTGAGGSEAMKSRP